MREEQKLNNAIKQDGIDTQTDILEELKRRYPQYVEQSDNNFTPVKKKRVALISALAAVAVCAAIIIPCSILLPNRDSGGGNNNRYCTQSEYKKNYAEFTIGEYRETNNHNYLYFDWYETGEEFITECYIANSDNEMLCLEEQAYLPQSDEVVKISLTKVNVFLSEFDMLLEDCDNEHSVNNHSVKWSKNAKEAVCVFEDGEYRYFISILEGQDENRLFELVAELLETK